MIKFFFVKQHTLKRSRIMKKDGVIISPISLLLLLMTTIITITCEKKEPRPRNSFLSVFLYIFGRKRKIQKALQSQIVIGGTKKSNGKKSKK